MTTTATYNKSAWLGNYPAHWQVLRIKNIFSEIEDRSTSGNEELLSVSHYTGVTLKRDSLENEDDFISNAETLEGYKRVAKGDLVINIMLAWNGSLGISPFDGITSPAYCVYRAKENNNPEYFGYLFATNLLKTEFRKKSTGIIDSRLRLYSDKFFSIFSVVPPVEEQNKIVEYIKTQSQKINHFIAKKQQFIALLKEQRQSVINEAVTKGGNNWITKRLKYISDLRFSNVDKHTIEGEEIVRLCNYVDVYKNDFITNDMELMVASATLAEIDKFSVLKNDIIITKDSETPEDIAVPTLVIEDLENVVCGYHLALIRADETQILSEYLFRVFQSKKINSHFRIGATGVTRVGLSLDDITGVSIPFPKSLSEQTQIINHIKTETTTIDTAIAKTLKEIELIKEYKEAMIAEAVMGKVNFNKL
ncbi:restriction endonuclease subunit S [Sediminibacterium sp.]|uniref:restriction endonuclease subunit S n=1 Tax=Sediminibacterium sp. TaxID=1917865 RepID=UPI0025D51808|nr:restriction endonuclease subunit S [Sediminibacterium sp.]